MSALAPLLAVYTLLNATTYSVVSSPSLASPPPYSSLHIVAGESPDALATGSATDLSQSLGFTRLSITTPVAAAEEENVDVLTSTMSVGFLEGALTVNQTWVFMQEFAMYEIYPLLAKTSVYTYFETQYRYLRAQVDAHGSSSAYWERVGLLLAQLEGLVAGFNYAIGDQKYFIDVPRAIIINALPEFPEIVASLGKSREAVFGGSPVLLSWMERVVDKLPHCSALVKPTPDGNDLLTSHVTWSSYTLMGVRLIKNISFPGADAATVAFTSMPMYVWSVDDFYVTSHDLVVMETTNDIYNKSLYKYVRPEGTVCTFLRAAMAVRYATSGKEWCDIFTPYNSGTYCNQWIVTDKTNSLHILEQIPGLIVAKDMTDVMHKQTYWPSYNVPYFPQIYNLSGYTESYEECPRAQIFRRDQHTVTDLESLKHFMRSNDYKHDPLSHGNPSWAISSRFDLLPPDRQGEPFGAIDAKVTSAALRATQPLRFQAVFGPTHQSIPPFKWDASEYWYFPHANQLNEWNQTWTG